MNSFLDFINSQPLDQLLAWMLTIILLNALFKLTKGEKARLTSWGLWLVVGVGIIFVRLPESYGFFGFDPWIPLIRFVTYLIVLALAGEDWRRYFKVKKEREGKSNDVQKSV